MDESTTATESQGGSNEGQAAWAARCRAMKECWKAKESLWLGVIVLVLGVLGQILLYVVPSEEFATNSSYGDCQLIGSLRVAAEAAMYLGAVWVGVYLARWGVRKNKA